MDGESAILDFSTMETPSIESAPPEETPVVTPEAGGDETPTETPESPETPEGGQPDKPEQGKAAPLKAIRDAVKAFGEANPELGKHLKTLLDNEGRIRAYQETYPDVDTARSVKAAIEAVGGLDGIAELSRLRDTVEETDAMIENGDPEVIERMFSDSKEGPVKLLPHFLNRVEKESPEAFGNSLRPHLVRSLEAANFDGALAALSRLVADKPEAKEILDSIIGWKNEQKRLSEKTNLDTLAPERNKLTERETALNARETKQFEYEVGLEVKPHMNGEFGKHMASYLKNATNLSDAMKQDVARAWLSELGKATEKDKTQIEAMMKSKSRNKTAIANFVRSRISAVADGVTKKIVETYKLTPGKAAPAAGKKPGEEPPPTGAGSSPQSPLRIKEKPADSRIDWNADPDRMHFIAGKAKLVDGSKQWVKWR